MGRRTKLAQSLEKRAAAARARQHTPVTDLVADVPIDRTRRPAKWWATYPGDVRGVVGELFGPNAMGERLVAVEAYAGGSIGAGGMTIEHTRVGFALADVYDVRDAQLRDPADVEVWSAMRAEWSRLELEQLAASLRVGLALAAVGA